MSGLAGLLAHHVEPGIYRWHGHFPVEDGHRRHGTDSQELRRNIPPSRAPSCDAIGNYRLICCDVVRGHVLDGDLLLSSPPVVV